ncbi:MAG: nuclear transport factor 2 family protein [Solirubrobacterales bacterium]
MASDVESVREGIEALIRGDIDGMLAHMDPEIEVRDPDRTGDLFRGHEEIRGFIAEWMENFDDYRIEIDELREGTEGRLAALCTQSGRGKGSGIEISDQINMVFRFRNGKAIEYTIIGRREDALRHAGIEG